MPKVNLMKIRHQRKRAVRNKVVKITLLAVEFTQKELTNENNALRSPYKGARKRFGNKKWE